MKSLLSSRTFHSFLGIGVSLILILWVINDTDWRVVGRQLGHMSYFSFFPITAIFVFHFVLRAWRWKYLLPGNYEVSLRKLFDCILVGAFATFVLPLRAGEFVRPYLLTRYSQYSFSTSFVTVVVERFFDLTIVLLSFALMTLYIQEIPPWIHYGATILLLLAICLFIFMLLGTLAPSFIKRVLSPILSFLPDSWEIKASRFLADFLDGASILKRGGNLAKVCLLSLMVWFSCYTLFYLFFYLFGLHPSYWVAVSAAVIVALAVAAPSAPGFIGVYQVACVAAFSLFGLEKEVAVAYSIVSHGYQYVLFVVYGMYILIRDGVKFSELRNKS